MAETCLTGMGGSRGGGGTTGGTDPHPKDLKKGFLGNTGPDPLKIAKLLDQNSMLGHHRDASEMPF